MRYYHADEDIFEPAPEATIAAVPRLLDMLPPEEPAPSPRRRIIVTRHKPGEPFEVPLADEDVLRMLAMDIELNAQGLGVWLDRGRP